MHRFFFVSDQSPEQKWRETLQFFYFTFDSTHIIPGNIIQNQATTQHSIHQNTQNLLHFESIIESFIHPQFFYTFHIANNN